MPKKKTEKKRKRKPRPGEGRPTTYTKELANKICTIIATSAKSIRSICAQPDINIAVSSIFLWLTTYPEFSEQYANAREQQGLFMAEETNEISDKAVLDIITRKIPNFKASAYMQAVKLQVDTRKWHASHLATKTYGKKLDVTSKGDKLESSIVIAMPQNERGKKN